MSIGLDAPVVPIGWEVIEEKGEQKSVWLTANYAAGHHINSVSPGQGGNIVLSGHHNIEGEVFRYIVDLEPGNLISLQTEDGIWHQYAVSEKMILKEAGASEAERLQNAQHIEPTDDERVTLVTCWPYWTNTHRVIVIAKPAPD